MQRRVSPSLATADDGHRAAVIAARLADPVIVLYGVAFLSGLVLGWALLGK